MLLPCEGNVYVFPNKNFCDILSVVMLHERIVFLRGNGNVKVLRLLRKRPQHGKRCKPLEPSYEAALAH
jgi:hypothetical protein